MIFKLFSQREKEAKGVEDVYQYSTVSDKLRVQVQQILVEAIGKYWEPGYYAVNIPSNNNDGWEQISSILRREYGAHKLRNATNPAHEFMLFIADCNTSEFIDALEVACRYIERVLGDFPEYKLKQLSVKTDPSSAIEELNYRLRQDSFGFQYEDGSLIRLDDDFVHREVVKPAIRFLQRKEFAGARDEFFEAHRLYREGSYGLAVVECGKSFESALKTVCEIKGWSYERTDRASDLLRIVRRNGLIPDYLDKSFDQLSATLASGLPQVRNNEGAHGQGSTPRQVPRPIVEYALNLSASKILLLASLV